eukprot:GDKJ01036780.1.p1 GENE.GDKJ01036780.1~~GDKJ01036780.1.p1  ORF type:complete len:203 (-),score=48.75 GDKJ01036780.1:362-970(-)
MLQFSQSAFHSSVNTSFQKRSGALITTLRFKGDESRHSPWSAFVPRDFTYGPQDGKTKYERWEDDPRFQEHKRMANQGAVGMQSRVDLKKDNKKHLTLWVSPKEEPLSFVANMLIIFVFLYTIANLSKGETHPMRRRRVIREKLLKEYGLTEADLDEIEGMDSELSDGESDELKDEKLTSKSTHVAIKSGAGAPVNKAEIEE